MTPLTQTEPFPQQEALAFKKLLVAYDFSPYAQVALEYALDLARRQDAKITLLHVSPGARLQRRTAASMICATATASKAPLLPFSRRRGLWAKPSAAPWQNLSRMFSS
jgi:nucleotide-binding universal stress UspA family protein